jgi:hypothetical protein
MSSFGTIQIVAFHNLHIDNVTIHIFVHGVQLLLKKRIVTMESFFHFI